MTPETVAATLNVAGHAARLAASEKEAQQKLEGEKWIVRDGTTGREVGRLYGLCGFAWVKVFCNDEAGRAFLAALRKLKLYDPKGAGSGLWHKAYGGGIMLWCPLGTQDVDVKGAWAERYAEVLRVNLGIKAYSETRLD